MYKLVIADSELLTMGSSVRRELTKKAIKEARELLGAYNDAPVGFRRISADQFYERFGSYSPEFFEFKQINPDRMPQDVRESLVRDGIKHYLSCQCFHYSDGTGLCMSVQWHPVGGRGPSRYVPYFFAYGCEHAYREYSAAEAGRNNWPFTTGRCCHNTVCTKCGRFNFYDSGD